MTEHLDECEHLPLNVDIHGYYVDGDEFYFTGRCVLCNAVVSRSVSVKDIPKRIVREIFMEAKD